MTTTPSPSVLPDHSRNALGEGVEQPKPLELGVLYALTRSTDLQVASKVDSRFPEREAFRAGTSFSVVEIRQRNNIHRPGSTEMVYTLRSGDHEFFVMDGDNVLPGAVTLEKRGAKGEPTAGRIAGEDVRFRGGDSFGRKAEIISKALGITMALRDKAYRILSGAKNNPPQVNFAELSVSPPSNVVFKRVRLVNDQEGGSRFLVVGRRDEEKTQAQSPYGGHPVTVFSEPVHEREVTLRHAADSLKKVQANKDGVVEGYVSEERKPDSRPEGMGVVRAAHLVTSGDGFSRPDLRRKGDFDTTLCKLFRIAVQKVTDAPEPPPAPPARNTTSRERSGR